MKTHKPTTPSRRHMTTASFKKKVTSTTPHKALTKGKSKKAGRNNYGRITTRHQGGGHKRRYRQIDFTFDKKDIPARVETIEYDPNRSAYIALVCYADGERRYILAPEKLKVGDKIKVSESAKAKSGNRIPLKKAPLGTIVHAIEMKPGGGAQLARSAGVNAEVVARDGGYVNLKMPSGEVRKVEENCWASVGMVSNSEHARRVIGKAGRSRWLGKRPTVRGTAMNPVDHPMGGGEAKSRGQRVHKKTKWGKVVDPGKKTRRPKKYSNKLIVSRRKNKRRR